MSDKPHKSTGLLFCAEMVRADLEGRKTQTRRVVKPQPIPKEDGGWFWQGGPKLLKASYGDVYVHTDLDHVIQAMLKVCPYGRPGDEILGRETWATDRCLDDVKPSNLQAGFPCEFKAGGTNVYGYDKLVDRGRWRPSIFMAKHASRIHHILTAVRVERLQDITDRDALDEGISIPKNLTEAYKRGERLGPRNRYMQLWDRLNGKKHPWASNPWVWVLQWEP